MKIYTSKETKKIDSLAIKETAETGFTLMQSAAEFSLDVLVSEFNNVDEVLVFCGKGKNSGDGFLLASYAKEFGLSSIIVMCSPTKELKGVSKKAFNEAKSNGVKIINLNSLSKIKISKKAVLVDALIGTGLKGDLRKNIKEAILSLNKLGDRYPVISLDLPSGVCADTGFANEPSIVADVTCTFVTQKRGCFTSEGKALSGEVLYSDLDIPKKIFSKVLCKSHLIDMEDHLHKIILRDENSHKGAFGHAFIVGGNKGYGGAAILAAKAAAFSGAGLIGLGTRPEHLEASLLSP